MAKKLKGIGILVGVVAIVLAGVFLSVIVFQKWTPSNNDPEISSSLIASKLTEISEIASLEYSYTNVGKFEDQEDFYGWKVPLTAKNFIISYDGVMKMGIRGKDIVVKKEGNQILVTLPPAEILSHEIKEDTVEVFDQSKNVFNQILIQDYTAFATDRKSDMEEKALKNGLLQDAEERAEQQIGLLISSITGADGDYEVVFKNHSSQPNKRQDRQLVALT